ncbi:cytidine deaminase [Pasteurellaceae bacterium Pebbles2]|nr:cytidine deaminase [Pasteurellaceae bacterium Pebbles2]
MTITKQELMQQAREVLQHSYSPYSKFPVGCALLMNDGRVFTGVNVENASFGLTNCAERTAIFTAATAGYKPKSIQAIAISGDTDTFLSPCGACRQVLVEFCTAETPVYLTRRDGEIYETTVGKLVPLAFEQLDM